MPEEAGGRWWDVVPPPRLRRDYTLARRCVVSTTLAIDTLTTPIPAWLHASAATGGFQALAKAVDQLVVVPLQAAPDDVAWAATLDRVRSTWTGLRVALAQAGVGVAAAGAGEPLPLPFVALQEPAHGAAAHAVELLRWLGEQGASAARGQQASRDAEVLRQVVDDVAVIELCWLTLVGPRPPAACVADAAAWEAYSRARSAEPGLRSLGFDPSGMPRESADEAAARGLALLDAVAAGWTDEDRRAVERARVREPLAP